MGMLHAFSRAISLCCSFFRSIICCGQKTRILLVNHLTFLLRTNSNISNMSPSRISIFPRRSPTSSKVVDDTNWTLIRISPLSFSSKEGVTVKDKACLVHFIQIKITWTIGEVPPGKTCTYLYIFVGLQSALHGEPKSAPLAFPAKGNFGLDMGLSWCCKYLYTHRK